VRSEVLTINIDYRNGFSPPAHFELIGQMLEGRRAVIERFNALKLQAALLQPVLSTGYR